MAEIIVEVASQAVVSVMTRSSVESMGLKVGDTVVVVIKATEVMLATEP